MESIDYYANAFAQDKISFEEIKNFYKTSIENGKEYEMLDRMTFLLMQSGPQTRIIEDSIEVLPRHLKNSNAASILKNNHINNAIRKILGLPSSDYEKSFMVILFVFKASDTWRRENVCRNHCAHEWHNITW